MFCSFFPEFPAEGCAESRWGKRRAECGTVTEETPGARDTGLLLVADLMFLGPQGGTAQTQTCPLESLLPARLVWMLCLSKFRCPRVALQGGACNTAHTCRQLCTAPSPFTSTTSSDLDSPKPAEKTVTVGVQQWTNRDPKNGKKCLGPHSKSVTERGWSLGLETPLTRVLPPLL